MRTLVETLREHLGYQINENFGSEILRTTFVDVPTNKQLLKCHGGIGQELKWDIITNDKEKKIDTEQAGKLAYQRKDNPAYILWFDSDNQLLARTISNTAIYPGYRGGWKNVRKIQQAAAYAIVIKDYEKFDTTQLKRDRAEAKKGALAFMTDKQILKKNIERYREKLKEMKANKFDASKYSEEAKSVIEKLNNLVTTIPEDFVPDNWSKFNNNFQYLAQKARQLMDCAEKMMRYKSSMDYAREKYGDPDYYEDELARAIKDFDEGFNKFCIMYDIALKGEEVRWM